MPGSQSHDRPSDTATDARYGEFVGLLARHDQKIRRYVRSLLPSREGVDDVMQETALECWKKFGDFTAPSDDKDGNAFVLWACVIARYKTLSWQRDHARDRLVFREGVLEKLADAADAQLARQDDERRAVEACLAGFPEASRRILLSVHSAGDSVAKIAAETGNDARRLYTKLNNLRKQLLACVRQRLAPEVSDG